MPQPDLSSGQVPVGVMSNDLPIDSSREDDDETKNQPTTVDLQANDSPKSPAVSNGKAFRIVLGGDESAHRFT